MHSTYRRMLPLSLGLLVVVGCSVTSTDSNEASSAGASGSSGIGGATTAFTAPVSGGASSTASNSIGSGGAVTSSGTGSGDANATGGSQSSTGGQSSGGAVTNGGTNSSTGKGGTATGGGSGKGGSATGGAATGGGSGRGGSATGGAATGGAATGGAATGGAATGGTGGGSDEPNCAGSGWKLVWSNEFNEPAGTGVDSTSWNFDLGSQNGGWGNNELEYYTSDASNVATDGNGNLVITARKESRGGMEYTSARIKTQGLRSFKYGRIEGRLKIPQGQGIWPAFWMLGTDIASNQWPNCGEIDIMENVGKEPNIVHGSLHGPGYSGGSPLTGQTSLSEPVGNAFHLFAIEWDATSIRWYLDDKLYSTKTSSDVPNGSTWVYTHEFFIILNVAVGGTWPGSPNSSTVFPQEMLVDYVRVCQK